MEKVATDSEVNLNNERAAVYGSPCMELGLQALDRFEMQLVGKECARGVSCQRGVIQERRLVLTLGPIQIGLGARSLAQVQSMWWLHLVHTHT